MSRGRGRENTVWIAPGATTFSCLCERCLDTDVRGAGFLEAVRFATVRGTVEPDAQVALARCSIGHSVTVRRVERPPNLNRRDDRQLQLA
jgi:hypothetical protein